MLVCYLGLHVELDDHPMLSYCFLCSYCFRKMARPPSPPCRLCKSRCASSLATGKLFDIYFQPSFRHAVVRNYMKCDNYFVFSVGINAFCHFAFCTQIVPCNVRLKVNKPTGDTVTFEAPGGPTLWRLEEMDGSVSCPHVYH